MLRGTIRAFYEFDWKSAGDDFARALELNPALAAAYQRRSNWFLFPAGRIEEALAEAKQGLDLDPMNVITRIGEWFVLSAAGREEALDYARSLLALFPGFWIVCYSFATTGWSRGLYDESVAAIERGLATDPNNPHLLGMLALVRGSQGNREEAERFARKSSRPRSAGTCRCLCEGWRQQGAGRRIERFISWTEPWTSMSRSRFCTSCTGGAN